MAGSTLGELELSKTFVPVDFNIARNRFSVRPAGASDATALRMLLPEIRDAAISLVAVDEKILRPQNAQLASRRYDPSLPKGWQLAQFDPREAAAAYDAMLQAQRESDIPQNQRNQAINLPQTATNWIGQFNIGLALMLAALILFLMEKFYAA